MSNIATTRQSTAVGEFVSLLFEVLQQTGIRYCVLHGWHQLPETIGTDLDMVIDPAHTQKLSIVFERMASAGYHWIQCRHYAGCSYRFDFAWFEGKQFQVVGVDFISEYRYGGLILRSGQDLLAGRRLFRGFWIASPHTEFAYLLMKKCLKGSMSAEQAYTLQQLSYKLGKSKALQIASQLFGSDLAEKAMRAIAEQRLAPMLDDLRSVLGARLRRQSPGMRLRYHAVDKIRQVKRWLFPTGIMVVALGPDGVGKSTLLLQLAENLKPAFRSTHLFHYRATFRGQSQAPVLDPHSKPSRGYVLSVARLLLLYFQFWFSYLFIVRPRLERSGLVIFDRYFHDLLADRRRYRYAGPEWLPHLMLKLLPNRHAFVLFLDADETAIHSRKQEVSVAHLHTLRDRYKELGQLIPNSATIRTDTALEDSTSAATNAVYRYLLRRMSKRCPQWTQAHSTVAAE